MNQSSLRIQHCLGLCLVSVVMLADAATVVAQQQLGVRVPDGFEVSLFADDKLAHDIFSMTVDSLGRIVVSGPGYVRILVDSNSDGTADTFKQFADGPKSGAQGMYFIGRDLLCIGDAGLLRYRDRDGDDRADGPPEVFLKLKTGGEHHVHSIQKGPDGWWYLIAGNFAGIDKNYANLKTSPIKQPNAGTLFRLKPDLSGGEVVADGFRNAYDFAFNRQGDVFTFDSDGERDVSLPWYRPTRVFHILPGSNAGWFSRSWKRPNSFLDMPPVVVEFGRGSPTGVANYQHRRFPAKYHNALFVLDWTFGRVLALPLKSDGATWSSQPIRFMTAIGQFGFAPTDVEVGPDGSLFVSVGGRGTGGSVFRVTHKAASTETGKTNSNTTIDKKLASCLDAPQPLSSWSRARWIPLAKQLGAAPFVQAALNDQLTDARRMRAIEILTERFNGLDDDALKALARTDSIDVRARAAWSLGRTQTARPNTKLLSLFLNDNEPLVGRFALEALVGAENGIEFSPLLPNLAHQLGSKDRFNRQAAARIVPKLSTAEFHRLALQVRTTGWQAAVTNGVGYLARQSGFNRYSIQVGQPVLNGDHPVELKSQAVRLIQMGLGDVGPGGKLPPVFDGYVSRLDLTEHERELDPLRVLTAKMFPTGHANLDYELARLVAMLSPYNNKLLDRVLAQISDKSHPVDDIHYLIVSARIRGERTTAQLEAVAKALVELDAKIASRKLKQDSNWEPRIGELYAALVELDPDLPDALLRQQHFGRPGHVLFLSQLPADLLQSAIAAFARSVQQDDDYAWTNDVVFVFSESKDPAHRELIRKQYDSFATRNAVLVVLSQKPEPDDRGKFVTGLETSQMEILTACLAALEKLPASPAADEQVTLLRVLRRLGGDKREFQLRERVVKLLRRNTNQQFDFQVGELGYAAQSDAIRRWTEWIEKAFPDAVAQQFGGSGADLPKLKQQLVEVDWNAGDAQRGAKLFATRACAQCHGGRKALGPDLAGAAGRFSRDDLFTAIAVPNRDVSPRYQTTLVETTAGKVYSGLVVYESVDGILLRNATNQTFRIEADEIEFQRKRPESLMPNGLLKGMKPQDLADLYAYIRSLAGPIARTSGRRD